MFKNIVNWFKAICGKMAKKCFFLSLYFQIKSLEMQKGRSQSLLKEMIASVPEKDNFKLSDFE